MAGIWIGEWSCEVKGHYVLVTADSEGEILPFRQDRAAMRRCVESARRALDEADIRDATNGAEILRFGRHL